jgi:hypothetical protein
MKIYPPSENQDYGSHTLPAPQDDASGGAGGVDTQDEGGSIDTPATTINFVGAGVTATGGAGTTTVTIPGGSGVDTQEEGVGVDTPATTLNFVGAGVTATGGAGTTTVTISGGSGGVNTKEENVAVDTPATTMNFVGTPVTVTGGAGTSTVTVTTAWTTTTPAYATPLTVDLTNYAAYNNVQVDVGALTGNITLNITNGINAQKVNLRLLQDGTGGRTVAWGANMTAATDLPFPTLSTAANAIDFFLFHWDGTSGKARLLAYDRGFT